PQHDRRECHGDVSRRLPSVSRTHQPGSRPRVCRRQRMGRGRPGAGRHYHGHPDRRVADNTLMTAAVQTRGLSKDYGRGRGLFDPNLEIDEGEVLGYLGPNGAGKTTTIRLLMGLIHPTAGSATIFGLACQRPAVEAKRRGGYVPGELPQFGGLRGREIVAYMAGLRGGVDEKVVADICKRFSLDLGQRFREYSRGTKQKLAIVLGFMHRPRLLILDEPTGGLDPLNQQEFYKMCA